MNKKSKALLSIILIIVQLISLGLLGYSLVLYKGVETFYRIYGIIVLLYLLIFVGYLLLRSIKKKNKIAFVDCEIQVSKGFGVINPVADAFKSLTDDNNGVLWGRLLLPYNEFAILANSFGAVDRSEYTKGFEWLRDFE